MAYRDDIPDDYIAALNARFEQYVAALNREDRLSSLGFDLLRIGLSAATAFVPLADVDDLATVAITATAVSESLDRRVFSNRTFQAAIVAMRAERASILAEIEQNRLLATYTMGRAFHDLDRLQSAGRIEAGLDRLERAATQDRRVQEARLAAIPTACEGATENTDDINEEFRLLITGTPASGTEQVSRAQRVELAAAELALEPLEGQSATWLDVRTAYRARFCTDPTRRAFLERVASRIRAAAAGGAGGE